MNSLDISQKYKGLVNGKDWEAGSLRRYKNGLTAIHKDNNHFYVFEDSVSRYTGFKTTSGEEIYEGDFLAVSEKEEKKINMVYWDEGCQQWKVSPSPFQDPLLSQCLQNCLDSLVVGHVFTHQHLLKSVKINHQNE